MDTKIGPSQSHRGYHRTLWEIEGQLLCEHWISTDPNALFPTAYFCPSCGEIWARRICFVSGKKWTTREALCEKCGDGTLLSWDFSLYYILNNPIEVLKREILIYKGQGAR